MQRWLDRRELRAVCLTAVLLATSSCIVYISPRCLFDKGDGLAVVTLRFHPNNGTNLHVSYGKNGFVDTLADGDASFCSRLAPEAHRPIMEVLERPWMAVDQGLGFSEAMRYGPVEDGRPVPSRFLAYAQFDARARPPNVWWAKDLPTVPGHLERLDELFCAMEREVSYLRRTVKRYGAEFLEARGRELPCGVS